MNSNRYSKPAAMSSLVALSLALAACGGGGGVNSTPTPPSTPTPAPTPTPTPGPTNVMHKPLTSGTFAAQGNEAAATYVAGKAGGAIGAPLANGALSYDAAADSFNLVGGSSALKMTPADAPFNSSNLTSYEKTDGNTVTRLELNWGMRSDWTPAQEYVALGQLIAQTRDDAAGTDSYRTMDFAFGLPSSVTALPRVGRAAYELTLSGTRSSDATGYLLQMFGRGTALVDFGTGKLDLAGETQSVNYRGPAILVVESEGELKATASITAGKNEFSGNFTAKAGQSDTYTGTLTGAFYGPNTQDIGGTLIGTSGDHFYSLAFAGRDIPATLESDTLDNLKGARGLRTAQASFSSPLSDPLYEGIGSNVYYNGDTGTYTVGAGGNPLFFGISFNAANRAPEKDTADLRAYSSAHSLIDGKVDESIAIFDGETQGIELTYASFMRFSATRSNLAGDIIDQGTNYIAYGSFTPPDQMPRSGSASFEGVMFGDVHDGVKSLASLTGISVLGADFANGALTASLSPIRVNGDGTSSALGKFDFTGSIDTYSAAFAAAWNAGVGNMAGRFYGDKAQEYAAAFTINDPVAGQMTGISIGKRKDP